MSKKAKASAGVSPAHKAEVQRAVATLAGVGLEPVASVPAPAPDSPLAQFGAAVLDLLQESEEWSADTLDEVAHIGYRLGVARGTQAGDFARVGGRLLPGVPVLPAAPVVDLGALVGDLADALRETHQHEIDNNHAGDGPDGCSYCEVLARADALNLSKCDDCGAEVPEIVGCPDGAEVCPACFKAGAH